MVLSELCVRLEYGFVYIIWQAEMWFCVSGVSGCNVVFSELCVRLEYGFV